MGRYIEEADKSCGLRWRAVAWPAAHRFVAELEPRARRDLLRVLTSSGEVRADVIRQFHERGEDVMTEVLIALEGKNDAARRAVDRRASAQSLDTSLNLVPSQSLDTSLNLVPW